jgi:uncharacterized protein
MNRTTRAALVFAGLVLTTGGADAASFCADARHADERTICRTRGMLRADANMNRYYNKLLSELGPYRRWRLRTHQREWLADRRACGSDPTCIRLAYRERVHTLRSIADRRGVDLDE